MASAGADSMPGLWQALGAGHGVSRGRKRQTTIPLTDESAWAQTTARIRGAGYEAQAHPLGGRDRTVATIIAMTGGISRLVT
jgi:hypothetical protein